MATLTHSAMDQDSFVFTGNFCDQLIASRRRTQAVRAAESVRPMRSAQPGVRLTARGRRLVAGLVIGLVALVIYGVSSLFAGFAAASTTDITYSDTSIVVLAPGQTLWEIATEIDSSADPRAIIDVIEDLNGLGNDELIQAGSVLVVPVVE